MNKYQQNSIFSYSFSSLSEKDMIGLRLVEAAIFSAQEPISTTKLLDLLKQHDLLPADGIDHLSYVEQIIKILEKEYEARGISLVAVGYGWQFRTALDLAPYLTKIVERPRKLSKPALEALAVIAYHQPCTRADIEAIRGVSLNAQIIDSLLEASLIVSKGYKEVPGRPALWGTTEMFLQHFGLTSLRDLPKREELLVDIPGKSISHDNDE